MSTDHFESEIIDLLRSNFPGISDIHHGSSLFRSGLFDSMSLLIAFSVIEDTFNLKILDNNFDIKQFDTVRDIAAFIRNARQEV